MVHETFPKDDVLLTTAQTAELLRIRPQTLRAWRHAANRRKSCPPAAYRLGGRVLYSRMEVLSWLYLQFIKKPAGLLNVEGYFDPLLSFFRHAAGEGFMPESYEELFTVNGDPLRLISEMENYIPPDGPLVQRPTPT